MRLLIDFTTATDTSKKDAPTVKPISLNWKYALATLILSMAIALPEVSEWIESQRPILLLQQFTKAQKATKSKGTVFPAIKNSPITSGFGWRIHPITRKRKFHAGIDFGAPTGTPIYAYQAGLVEFAGWKSGYGKAVIINHCAGFSTLYGHASKIVVRKGEQVVAGETIAKIGSTGMSTGPHLHFEVRVNNKPVNPRPYLQRGVTSK